MKMGSIVDHTALVQAEPLNAGLAYSERKKLDVGPHEVQTGQIRMKDSTKY